MVGKKGTSTGATGGSFSVAGIPSGGAQAITVSFKQNNQNLSVSVAGTGYTGSISGKPGAAGERTFDVTVDDGADATFTLTFQAAATSNVRVDDILVTVKTAGEGAGTPKTLTGVAVSGTPTKTVYNTGENFDPTGLTVTGTYSDASTAPISSGITWAYTPSQTLALNQTSIGVTATVSEITSAEYNVTGLTVSDPVVSSWQVIAPADLVTGDMVVLTMLKNAVYYAAPNNGGSSAPTATAVTVVGDKLSNEPAATLQWEVTVVSAGVYQFSVGENYLKCTDTNNGVKVGTGDYNTFNVVEENEKFYLHTTETMTSAASGRYLGIYNTQDWRCYSSVNNNIKDGSLVIFKDASAAATVAKPTISGDENFVGSTTVTITHADADHIYYTTDGTDPTTSSTLYEGSFSLNATATVKAIAVKGSDESQVAEKEFTKVTALSTMADVQAAATSSETAINVSIANWVVTAVSGSQVWMAAPDNLKGILLYKSGHGFVAGNKLNGLVVGTKIKLYNDYPELTSLVAGDVAITTADAITARTTTIADLTSGHPAEQGTIVKLENLTYTASSTSFSDGANSIQIDSKLYSPALVDGASYTITGVVEYLASNVIKIMPRSVDDVEQTSGGGLPEVDGLAELKAEATGASYLVNLTDAVVTLVSGNNAFIEDATAGALIFYSGHGLVAGDKLNGQYEVTTATYQGKFEITAMEAQTGAEKTSGAEIPVTTLTIAQLNANFAANESKRIKIVGANVTDAISGSDRNGAINDGAALAVYAGVASTITLAENDNVDIIGYPGFHNSDQQLTVWAQADITVNVKDDPELSYSPASVNLTVGDALSAPTFNNPHTLSPITYNTNNDAVATVDEFGAITLVGGTGTAVITASYAGDVTYNAGNATFTINVYDPAAAPKNVVIIAEYNTKFYAMSTALNTTSNYCPAIEVEKDGGNIVVTSAEDKAAIQWSMAVDEGVSPKTASFQAGVDEYLKGTSSGAGLSFNATPFSWEWDDTNNCYIVSSSTRGFFYKNDGIFKNYALSNLTNAAYAGVEIIEIDPANIIISSKVSAELAYDPATLTITQGDAWSAPTLGYVVGFDGLAAITYASDNEAVATVTDAGVISLAGGTGTATITATFAGNANYLAGNATYAITVNAPAATPTGTTYTKVTSTAEITDGEYLIVYEGDGATHAAMAFNGSLDNVDQALKAIAVTIVGDEIAGNTDLDAATFTIDVAAGTLQSASGYYIGRTENSNGMEKNNVTTYSNTFAITEGKAVITSEGGPTLRYNYASDQLRFRYYKTGQQDIQLYKKVIVTPPTPAYTDIRTGLTAGNYYTVCWPKAMTAIKGGTLWSFAGKDASMAYLVQQTAPFVAGRPYIIYATDTKLEAVVEGDDATAGNYNGLYGTLSYMDADALSSAGATYMLKSNELRPIGTNNHLDANRAYVILDNITGGKPAGVPAHMVRSMPLKQDTTTGMDNLNASETPVKVMINGQMYILRGEKMYNANGQLVK